MKKYPKASIRFSEKTALLLATVGILDRRTGTQRKDNNINLSKLVNELLQNHFSKVDPDNAKIEYNKILAKELNSQVLSINQKLMQLKEENDKLRKKINKSES